LQCPSALEGSALALILVLNVVSGVWRWAVALWSQGLGFQVLTRLDLCASPGLLVRALLLQTQGHWCVRRWWSGVDSSSLYSLLFPHVTA
jgi:hypothetical protein